MKTLNKGDEGNERNIEQVIQMKMNRELLKLVLGSRDKDYVKYISYKNILDRIREGSKWDMFQRLTEKRNTL